MDRLLDKISSIDPGAVAVGVHVISLEHRAEGDHTVAPVSTSSTSESRWNCLG